MGSLKPRRSLKIAKFVGSAAASGEISELSGSIGESLDAKKIIALIASAIGIMIAIRRMMKAISFFSFGSICFFWLKANQWVEFLRPTDSTTYVLGTFDIKKVTS